MGSFSPFPAADRSFLGDAAAGALDFDGVSPVVVLDGATSFTMIPVAGVYRLPSSPAIISEIFCASARIRSGAQLVNATGSPACRLNAAGRVTIDAGRTTPAIVTRGASTKTAGQAATGNGGAGGAGSGTGAAGGASTKGNHDLADMQINGAGSGAKGGQGGPSTTGGAGGTGGGGLVLRCDDLVVGDPVSAFVAFPLLDARGNDGAAAVAGNTDGGGAGGAGSAVIVVTGSISIGGALYGTAAALVSCAGGAGGAGNGSGVAGGTGSPGRVAQWVSGIAVPVPVS